MFFAARAISGHGPSSLIVHHFLIFFFLLFDQKNIAKQKILVKSGFYNLFAKIVVHSPATHLSPHNVPLFIWLSCIEGPGLVSVMWIARLYSLLDPIMNVLRWDHVIRLPVWLSAVMALYSNTLLTISLYSYILLIMSLYSYVLLTMSLYSYVLLNMSLYSYLLLTMYSFCEVYQCWRCAW